MEGKDGRRRFVQSTLFPHRGSSAKEDENCGAGEGSWEEEEFCSSGKKRRRVANSKSKATPPTSSKNVVENGKETSSKQIDEIDSSVPDKHNFFVKASQRVQQRGQDNHVVIIDSHEGNDDVCSPPCPTANGTSTPQKLKRCANSTPRKERRNSTPTKKTKNGRKELFCGQIPFEVPVDEQSLQTIPDLRLEAKLAAEENSRIFAGRRLHPFFTSKRGGKTNQDLADLESKFLSFEKKENGITLKPIHVFENVEDNQTTLDWGHWIFSESSIGGGLDCGYPPVFEGSVDSMNFGNFLNVSRFSRPSLYEECRQCFMPQRKASEELPYQPESSVPTSSLILADVRVICSEQQKDPDLPDDTKTTLGVSPLQGNESEGNDLSIEISCGGSIDSEPQEELLHERIISHHQACHSQHENCLWTDKYQPQNAKQICGNGESVKFLSEWLHLWHKRGSLASRSCPNEGNLVKQDTDHDYQQSDSDYDTVGDEEDLKNVLLITGPVGSGKSAAIYACARDQGFQIIEINASDWRNGALVRQKFGEAVESHWHQRSAKNAANSDSISQIKFKAINEDTNCSSNEVIELSDKEDSVEAGSWSKLLVSAKNRTASHQNEIKTLILFEDVDATLYEDHGFVATIQQLAETAKRPMILTSNSDNPVLPKNLDRLELRFSMPSEAELLELVHMICASEQAKIHPSLVERFVNHCKGDIRKTIMLLQFWCQGERLGEDYAGSKFHTTHWQVLFDLDAGHHILPKVIHWDYPSKLSDLVAEEVVKSLILMEETYNLMDKNNAGGSTDYDTKTMPTQESEADPIEVKKKAMLRLHRSHDEVECPQFEADNDLFDLSCSPVASTQKRGRRKINTVLSSDSEDEFSGCKVPLDSAGLDINVEVVDMTNLLISQHLSTQIHDHSTRSAFHSEANKLEDHLLLPDREVYSQTEDDTCRSGDVSLVPESSFVPETELINENELHSVTVSYGSFFDAMRPNLIFEDQDSVAIIEPAFDANPNRPLHIQEIVGINSQTSTTYAFQEEVGDSLSKSVADVPRDYQFLDECSRVDLVKGLKYLDSPEADQGVDFVKETWKKLYDQCNDLRKYVTAEEKTASKGLKLAHGMSNLISEADLLIKVCPNLASDFGGSSMIPNEKIHSCCYYEDQMEMSSILAQHGLCLYAKEIAFLGSIMGATNTLDLASEIVLYSANSVALGKLANQDQRKVVGSDTETAKDLNHLTSSKSDTCIRSILQTIVPPRSYLAASEGNASHEYIATLSQISRFEASRISQCINNRTQRRARVPRHYLSSGSLAMPPEEISLLGQYNGYKKGQV